MRHLVGLLFALSSFAACVEQAPEVSEDTEEVNWPGVYPTLPYPSCTASLVCRCEHASCWTETLVSCKPLAMSQSFFEVLYGQRTPLAEEPASTSTVWFQGGYTDGPRRFSVCTSDWRVPCVDLFVDATGTVCTPPPPPPVCATGQHWCGEAMGCVSTTTLCE